VRQISFLGRFWTGPANLKHHKDGAQHRTLGIVLAEWRALSLRAVLLALGELPGRPPYVMRAWRCGASRRCSP
jgi:hypothetical protein